MQARLVPARENNFSHLDVLWLTLLVLFKLESDCATNLATSHSSWKLRRVLTASQKYDFAARGEKRPNQIGQATHNQYTAIAMAQ